MALAELPARQAGIRHVVEMDWRGCHQTTGSQTDPSGCVSVLQGANVVWFIVERAGQGVHKPARHLMIVSDSLTDFHILPTLNHSALRTERERIREGERIRARGRRNKNKEENKQRLSTRDRESD